MNLIIDVGNTSIKLAVFVQDELAKRVVSLTETFSEDLEQLVEDFPSLQHCIVSSVGGFGKKELDLLGEKFEVLELNHKTPVLFQNNYETPTTLGVDRIALVSAAAAQYPDENILVIDAGSCITYDFLTAKNEYLGGAISPGLQMRYKALNTFTANLPLLETETPETFIGGSTQDSMHIGVVKGMAHEIDGFIEEYKEDFYDLTVILTGGDTHFLRDRIKNDIFANSNFLLEGLNHILEYNKDSC
ncbi:type III pantothenate kinase [Aureisphaera galaxeae]|uniref:type III pantothenate kinase n=1 Tax=Aureisphaera galaxeae TaxID=1538023 RepID=UPI00234FD50D|nr:type III pantothenate kinase [Aureisphaera galaxeae]MDC8003015.1 type III pantothenate kinase [Aureisphaera galaxeae]